MSVATAETVIRDLYERRFREIPEAPKRPELRPGARVRNYGEQFDQAIFEGTAVVVAVMRRGTDEQPDSWEQSWHRPNVEVVIERDADRVGFGAPKVTNWADYGTVLAIGRSEDQMRMAVTPRDADFGYDGEPTTLTPEQRAAWETNSPESVIGNPAARLDTADVGHTADLEGEW